MSADTAMLALKQIPGWENTADIELRSIGNGNTNTSWHIEREGRSFVLRIDSPVAANLGLDRDNEILVRTHVAAAGLAPKVIYADPDGGILLSDYVTGCTWAPGDVRIEHNLMNLAQTLRKLYALPAVGVTFDPGRALSRYADQLKDDASLERARQALNILKTMGKRKQVLCHNDLVASNIIAGEQLWLIDWEYAGVGDPLFDLAVVIEHHDVDNELALQFVETSLGSMSREIAKDLGAYCEMYRHLVALWRAIV